mmetsp:Transcript_118687/g.332383  ORF Transcript_118687/g.332383 Transcript_118687/m.332383 type:complete len:312 (+) Transcript_118687:141-1076(+)
MILNPARQSLQVLDFLAAASLKISSSHTAPFFLAASFKGVRPSIEEAIGSACFERSSLTIFSVGPLSTRPSANSSTTQSSADTPSCMKARASAPKLMSKLTAASCPAPLAVMSAVSPSPSALFGSALPARSSSIIFTWPRCAALHRGLKLFPLTSWSGLAFLESKKLVTVGLPALQARDSAVSPRMLEVLTSEPASSRTRRLFMVPGESSRMRFLPPAAKRNGVMPSESRRSMLALARRRVSTTSACPVEAAYISAVRSKASPSSTRTPLPASIDVTWGMSPSCPASISGVARLGLASSTSSEPPEARASS